MYFTLLSFYFLGVGVLTDTNELMKLSDFTKESEM